MSFSFNEFRGEAGKALKGRLTESGEVFDVLSVEEDMGENGPMWVLTIKYGDMQEGKLFFSQSRNGDGDSRDMAFAALAGFIADAPGVLVPAVLRHTKTRSGRDYYWLEDPR